MANPPGEPQVQNAPPVCYRHPGRPTYVSCVRCGRPACPDCLRPAAVGHQCVECIREGNQGVRRGASPFRNPAMAGARVTWALIGINILIFIVEQVHNQLFYDWGLFSGGVASGQWYRMITSALIPPTGW